MVSDYQNLLQKDEYELLVMIGEQLTQGEAGAAPLTPKQLANRAKIWLSSILTETQESLCENEAVKVLYNQADVIALIGAIGDVIGAFCGVIIPATVATLIFKLGVGNICQDLWEKSKANPEKGD